MSKRNNLALLSFLFLFHLISCGHQQPEQKAAPAIGNMGTSNDGIKIEMSLLASPVDLACGMSLTDGISDTTTYDGKLYGFCSTGCKTDFLKEPGKYIKLK